MSDLVPAEQIEQIVGAKRHSHQHLGRAVASEETVYVLHSQRCKDSGIDLRECEWSLALDRGIDLDDWRDYEDRPVVLAFRRGIQRGHTACTEEHPPEERNTVSEPTQSTETPPQPRLPDPERKKPSTRAKKTTAPPPEQDAPKFDVALLTPGQQRRLKVLSAAARLLDDGETRGTAGELLALAAYIEGQDVDDDPATVLTFTPTTQPTSTTHIEGAAQ